jgi:ABC-type bacteriocin/lantibiotic exporter with double-glycine peptidase domain
MSKKVLIYPETRQVYDYDCGANSLMSMLVFAGVEEREERIMKLAGTTKEDGTQTEGVLFAFGYFGQPIKAGCGMTPADLRKAVDKGFPTMLTLQAYRDAEIIIPYKDIWDQGHWVVAIGYEDDRIIFEDPASFHRTWLRDGELIERWHDTDGGTGNGKKIVGWGCTLMVSGIYKHDLQEHMD